nr:DUF1905 domain-containing protein [uncultured Draconibacterium sp.]
MQAKIKYTFSGKLWKYAGQAGWHFISLPNEISKEIRENLKWQEEGWGRMKAIATIEKEEWRTAIWFDKKLNTYLLPIKADIRKKLKLETGQMLVVNISI